MRPCPVLFGILLSCGLASGAVAAEPAPARCGAGGLALPGTATCLRLGGVARADAAAASRPAPPLAAGPAARGGRAATALRAQGRIDLDARTPTAYGPLRAYLSVGSGDPRR